MFCKTAVAEGEVSPGVYSHIKCVCMCRPILKRNKKKGAYGADQTETVGAYRAERMVKVVELIELKRKGAFRAYKTQKGGLYRGTPVLI